MTLPLVHIGNMASYALANLEAGNADRIISMAQNESLRPPSPNAAEAALNTLRDTALYPDPNWLELRTAIASVHHIKEELILCGSGSMELISSITRAFLGPGDELLSSEYAYAFIKTACLFTDAVYRAVPESERTVSTEAILDAITEKTKIVFVANPGNPTGTRISSKELRDLRGAIDQDIMLVIDEAYGEFCDALDERVFDLAETGNTVILRTFSKAYGLAGMRVGWGYFPHGISEQVRKVLNPNNIPITSQAMATAVILDRDYMNETCELTSDLRNRFTEELRAFGISVDDSHTNFVLLRLTDESKAAETNRYLISKGIVMRSMQGYGLGNCLRATIVGAEDMEFVSQTLRRWFEEERNDG